MSLSSNDDFRYWLLPLVWGVIIFYLVSGYVLYVGKWTGIHIYSRKKQASDYWFHWFLNLAIAVAITYILVIKFG